MELKLTTLNEMDVVRHCIDLQVHSTSPLKMGSAEYKKLKDRFKRTFMKEAR